MASFSSIVAEQQLKWLKDQLFGRKSERRQMVDPTLQSSLFASLGVTVPSPPSEPEATPAPNGRRKKSRQGTVTDEGLRLGSDVPVEVIEVPALELPGPDAADYEIISNKSTFRLARRPGSHVVREYRAPVAKHVPTGKLKTTPVPGNVLERSVADVSFLAGLAMDETYMKAGRKAPGKMHQGCFWPLYGDAGRSQLHLRQHPGPVGDP